jgi:hypothetical protein
MRGWLAVPTGAVLAGLVALSLATGTRADIPLDSGQAVAAAGAHSCTIREDGTLACWGSDSQGQVSGTPEGEFLSVAAGGAHNCAIRVDRTLACWGDDSSGQVSEAPGPSFGSHHHRYSPGFLSVSAGEAFACARYGDGDLTCWGDDSSGQVSEAPSGDFRSVAAGGSHACAIRDDGQLACWGSDSQGQVSEAPEGEFLAVAAGGAHNCAIRVDRTLACWGDDSSGQVSEAPEGEFLAVAAGGAHNCAIRADGTLACWGDNEAGQVQPLILPPEPPEGTVGDPYVHVFETTPQFPHPVFGLAGGSLPDGLELGEDGTLSGTPTAAGAFPFALAAADGVLPDAEAEETVKIAPAPEVLAPPAVVSQAVSEGLPPPTAGKTVNVTPAGGTVQIECPGEAVAHLLSPEQIPIECLVDVRRGTVHLESSTGSANETRSGLFWGGVFGVLQKAEDNWETELRLAGRLKCEKRKDSGARLSRRTYKRGKGGGRKLWGSGKGNFKTSGNYGSASVRGTTWLVVDRCDNSTLFKVREGTVWVNDFVKEKTVVLTQGEQYVAKAAIPRLK